MVWNMLSQLIKNSTDECRLIIALAFGINGSISKNLSQWMVEDQGYTKHARSLSSYHIPRIIKNRKQ